MTQTDKEVKKLWIVKYALTEGIIQREVSVRGDYAYPAYFGSASFVSLKIGRDAFVCYAEAQTAAEKMREKKIASLEKQLKKLHAMVF